MSRSDSRWLRSPCERVGTLSHAALPPPASAEEQTLVRALREGDEGAFEMLLDRYYSPMLRLARAHVRSREEAEEVVQDTWMAVLSGLDRFEGRSSLKTWIFRILVNRARTRARRETRLVPFSSLSSPSVHSGTEGDVDPDWLFNAASAASTAWHGSGAESRTPEECLLANELHALIEAAIERLPPRQQEVITLRDLEGWSADEVCDLLDISDANQRVLLHRARVGIRAALEEYFQPPRSEEVATAG